MTTEDRENLLLWADYWYGDTTKCITNDFIVGKCTKAAEQKLFKVYYLRKTINNATDRLTEEQIDILYGRLQCLINLTISE